MRRRFFLGAALAALFGVGVRAAAQEDPVAPDVSRGSVLQLHFTPTRFAQIAVWLERADGTFEKTLLLTDAVARRGIGNRPGASQMNSGFHWPYGRRDGVLPVWGTRRAAAPDARPFRTVIFQNRISEGFATRNSNDFSFDDYFCLSFQQQRSTRDELDAVSCATPFSSDKGRFLTEDDLARGYAEPWLNPDDGQSRMRPLSLESLYPPRRDVMACTEGCYDHADVATYDAHAREVMPEIDVVARATLQGDVPAKGLVFELPTDLAPGDYRACLEINVEGDYSPAFNPDTIPSAPPPPANPPPGWDSWATGYGYPYRGQPSVVYCVDFPLPVAAVERLGTDTPAGSSGTWDTDAADYGALVAADDLTDDPVMFPGSGADRLRADEDGSRFEVVVKPPLSCADDAPPGPVADLAAGTYPDEQHAHQWVELRFRAAEDDQGVQRYDVRVSTEPIVDEESFMRAEPAKSATLEADELFVPTDSPEGEMIELEMGGLVSETHYYVGVRAVDECAGVGPIEVTEITTEERVFATVTPCFVATAAWGTPFADEIGALRRARDRYLLSHAPGRALVAAYHAVGPRFADAVRDRPALRAFARALLTPLVRLADSLEQ
jgi:hypothetical protein